MPSFDLIVFDLDDTLVDTWGQMVKPAAREACAAMIAAGLAAELDDCVAERARLFLEDPREDVYRSLVTRFGLRADAPLSEDGVRDQGFRAFFHRQVEPHIELLPGARQTLTYFKGRGCRLHLVTSGSPETQEQKIEILKLEPLFDQIHLVPLDRRKGDVFSAILEQTGIAPARALAVGDRPDKEIRDAKALGMKTCRVRRGEFSHLQPAGPQERADWEIDRVAELERLT